MNSQEHSLMIAMLARQAMLIKMLIEILKSRGIVENDDVKAFNLYVLDSEEADPSILQDTAKIYSQMAAKFGLDVPLIDFSK